MEFTTKLISSTINIQYGFNTDIGDGHENQDDFLIFKQDNVSIFVMIDGHGKEFGKIASCAVRLSILEFLTNHLIDLKNNPVETLKNIFIMAHNAIRESIKKDMLKKNCDFIETIDGCLLKKRFMLNVFGGATCSIIAIIDDNAYIANVGDSSGILFSNSPILNQDRDIKHICDYADLEKDGNKSLNLQDISSDFILLTPEHSPENPYEINRIKNFRSENRALFLYDNTNIQIDDPINENITFEQIKDSGGYYKNVRNEWATMIRTPFSEPIKYSLAMTRSLGDFKLNSYGISHLPEVKCINLRTILELQKIKHTTSPLCIVLATDGVWDNWKFEDVKNFVMDKSCLETVSNKNTGAKDVSSSFMENNKIYGEKNFGKNSDNSTCIVIYISDEKDFKGIHENITISKESINANPSI